MINGYCVWNKDCKVQSNKVLETDHDLIDVSVIPVVKKTVR